MYIGIITDNNGVYLYTIKVNSVWTDTPEEYITAYLEENEVLAEVIIIAKEAVV